MNITIIKKSSEELLDKTIVDTNVKLLSVKKNEKRYLKGMQIILDQYVCDCISKDYKTDSLYSVEQNGTPLMFYEILLDSYVLPPSEKTQMSNWKFIKKKLPNLQMSLLMIYTALRFLTLMQSVSLKKLTLYLYWINFKTTKLYQSVLRRT